MADTQEHANKAFDLFLAAYQDKYPKAVQCRHKDRESLLAFYDLPAQHWHHIRTTNPIESTFATIKLRTHRKPRGVCLGKLAWLCSISLPCLLKTDGLDCVDPNSPPTS